MLATPNGKMTMIEIMSCQEVRRPWKRYQVARKQRSDPPIDQAVRVFQNKLVSSEVCVVLGSKGEHSNEPEKILPEGDSEFETRV